jgi:preprotein translocase subunit YajC
VFEQKVMEEGNAMATWIPIVALVLFSLISVVWFTLTRKVEKHDDTLIEHGKELARGDEKFNAVQSKLEEIHTDVREVKKQCPKCSG